MASVRDFLRNGGILTRSAVLLAQWLGCYVLAILGFGAGMIGVPVAMAAVFLAVYALFRQVDGLVDERLAE